MHLLASTFLYTFTFKFKVNIQTKKEEKSVRLKKKSPLKKLFDEITGQIIYYVGIIITNIVAYVTV